MPAHPKANPVRGRRRPALAVVDAVVVPRAPARLGDVGREVWDVVWRAGALKPGGDEFVAERYASLHDRRARFLAAIEEDGWTQTGHRGVVSVTPWVRLLKDVETKLVA